MTQRLVTGLLMLAFAALAQHSVDPRNTGGLPEAFTIPTTTPMPTPTTRLAG
jgi:hypothetical protein